MQFRYSTDSERLIIALINNDSVAAQKLLDDGLIDPVEIERLSGRHMISPLVHKRLSNLGLEGAMEEWFALDGGKTVRGAAAVTMRLRYELKLVTRLLETDGIDFLLIKGFAVDKDPLRVMNDIDILIHGNDLRKVFTLLEEAGYRYMGSGVMSRKEISDPFSTLDWNNQFQFESRTGMVGIEVHTNLFERDRIRLEDLDRLLDKVDLFWERRVWDTELACSIPSAEATLALLCLHSSTKRSPAHNTYILRHAYDIAGIFVRGIDEERFLFLCREWGIEYYACTALRLTALCLGIEQPLDTAASLEPFLNSRKRLVSRIHIKCFRGLGDASLIYRKLYTLFMPAALVGSFRKGLRWYRKELIFPPLWVQETRFGIKRSSPVIYLTYLYGPFLRVFDILTRRSGRR